MNNININKNYVIIGVIVLIALWVLVSYNGLVKSNLSVDSGWAQVESQYQRRLDLIPNLVSSVQGVLKQEKDVFIALAEARQGYAGAKTVNEKVAAASQIETSLGRLLAIVENYPQLKSSEAMQTLMAQLEGTENRVAVERMRFNDSVKAYNVKTKTFPSNLIAKMFGFEERNFFEAVKGAEVAPQVKF